MTANKPAIENNYAHLAGAFISPHLILTKPLPLEGESEYSPLPPIGDCHSGGSGSGCKCHATLLPKTCLRTCYKTEHIPATLEVLHCHSSAPLYRAITNYRTSVSPEKGDACQETTFHRRSTPGCRSAPKGDQPCNPQLGRMARAARSPNSHHPDAGPSEAYCFLSPPSALGAEPPRSHRRGTTREPPGFTYISHCRSGRQWPPPGRPTLAFCPDFLSAFPSQRG